MAVKSQSILVNSGFPASPDALKWTISSKVRVIWQECVIGFALWHGSPWFGTARLFVERTSCGQPDIQRGRPTGGLFLQTHLWNNYDGFIGTKTTALLSITTAASITIILILWRCNSIRSESPTTKSRNQLIEKRSKDGPLFFRCKWYRLPFALPYGAVLTTLWHASRCTPGSSLNVTRGRSWRSFAGRISCLPWRTFSMSFKESTTWYAVLRAKSLLSRQ